MSSPSHPSCWQHESTFRVNYYETDGQRRVHHSNYLNYFERGRVQMLRDIGINYKSFEDQGRMLVVTEMNIQYHTAAEFDDLLRLVIEVTQVRKIRIGHRYQIFRDQTPIVSAESVIACVDSQGKPERLPDDLLNQWRRMSSAPST